ncbi:hypothetical protein [Tsukamurella pseudospumae]|uniref:Lipoprotein LpqJ n=1 Tax=Tsukamurella pseudospumae TaxID=239498 RepID=A0A137ZHS1_9ACTN|nr:hypothetical protein [Tsukamurella pseudospumae]KXO97734.1 hypothetical protein AXK61_22155 [Tsukamurella pseudospumae]
MGTTMKVAGAVLFATVAVAGCGDGSRSAGPTVTVTAAPSASPGGSSAGTQQPETPTRTATAAPTAANRTVTALPTAGQAVRVLTESGKTTCNIRAELVECQSVEFGKTYRAKTGEPATGFVYRDGALGWYYGNMAVTAPATTIRYGSTYSAYGWTVEASAGKTVFSRDGHGVSVDVTNTTTF